MTPEQSPDFLLRLAALGELFNAKLSEASQVLYFDALMDLDLHALIVAMAKAARLCKFMPKPVELRELVTGNLEEQAAAQWNGWKRAARSGGSWRSVICDSVTASSLEATFGSWVDACVVELSPEMWANKRKEFIQNFRIYTFRQEGRISGHRLLRGNSSADGNPMFIDVDGSVTTVSFDTARELLTGTTDEREFNRRLSN